MDIYRLQQDLDVSSITALVTKQQLVSLLTHYQALQNDIEQHPVMLRTTEEWDEFEKLFKLTTLLSKLIAQADDTPQSLFSLFNADNFEPNAEHLEWFVALFKRAFSAENKLPVVLFNMRIESEEPLMFGAYIAYLARSGVSAKRILKSGLLQQFFLYNCWDMSCVTEMYTLLRSSIQPNAPEYNELNKLCRLASKTRGSKEPAYQRYALDGKLSRARLINVKIQPLNFSYYPSPENVYNLYSIFGDKFLAEALYLSTKEKNPRFSIQLIQLISQLETNNLARLYQVIESPDISDSKKIPILKLLGMFVSNEQMHALIREHDALFWMALVSKPSLLPEVIKQFPQRFKKSLPLRHVKYYCKLFSYQHILPSAILYNMRWVIFNLVLKKNLPEYELMRCIDYLKTQKDAEIWSINSTNRLLSSLLKLIDEKINAFSKEKYDEIVECYNKHRVICARLQEINQKYFVYPDGRYALQALIIRQAFLADKNLDINHYINLMPPTKDEYTSMGYSIQEYNLAKCRLLYQVLADVDMPLLQSKVIQLLKNGYQVTDWRMVILANGTNIQYRAVHQGNYPLLNLILKDESPLGYMHALNRINKDYSLDNEHPLLYFLCANPKAFVAFLSLYPSEERLKKLLGVKNYESYFHQPAVIEKAIQYPETFRLILKELCPFKELEILKHRCQSGNYVLDEIAQHYPETLKIIFECVWLPTCKSLLMDSGAEGLSSLHFALSNAASSRVIREKFTSIEIRDALKGISTEGRNAYYFAAADSESLNFLITLYPRECTLWALQQEDVKGVSALNIAARKKETMDVVLKSIPNNRFVAIKHRSELSSNITSDTYCLDLSALNFEAMSCAEIKKMLRSIPSSVQLVALEPNHFLPRNMLLMSPTVTLKQIRFKHYLEKIQQEIETLRDDNEKYQFGKFVYDKLMQAQQEFLEHRDRRIFVQDCLRTIDHALVVFQPYPEWRIILGELGSALASILSLGVANIYKKQRFLGFFKPKIVNTLVELRQDLHHIETENTVS
ncbi:hypothetical protein [Legionella yabuuchiae]|uniref:hypothetical protein n=1 Tax=Legionella yabuuchiae TaxID=376727 RepID=UPI001054B760|nr:hypothetical protein [Legionella yabuuchiae]